MSKPIAHALCKYQLQWLWNDKGIHTIRVWSCFETFFENFEKGLLPEIEKTDSYFYPIKMVTQTQFEACVTALISERTPSKNYGKM